MERIPHRDCNQTALLRQEVAYMPTAVSAGSALRLPGSDPRERTGIGCHEGILRGTSKTQLREYREKPGPTREARDYCRGNALTLHT